MFGSMGMFGAFGCDPEEVAKKNEEMVKRIRKIADAIIEEL